MASEHAVLSDRTLVREDAGDVDKGDRQICQQLVALDPDEIWNAPATEMRRSARRFSPVTLADQITWEDISRVAVNAPALPGVTPEVGLTRVYPHAMMISPMWSVMSARSSDYDLSKIEDPEPILRIPALSDRQGRASKPSAKSTLRGKAGAKRVEVNATGRVMRELDRQ